MGKWFDKFLSGCGFTVLVSDVDTELKATDLAESCQVVILAVPMDVFPEVVTQVAPAMAENGFLTDLCSLKEKQVACMLENSKCEVAGTHPLFGPGEKGIEGKRVALCPGRGHKWLKWWQGLLDEQGALTTIFSPEEHDRAMAWVQALNHFILLCLGKSLEEEEINIRHILELATPSFERQMNIVARLCLQDPKLYAAIQLDNPHSPKAIETFSRYAMELEGIVKRGDISSFLKMFNEVQQLGPTLLRHCRETG